MSFAKIDTNFTLPSRFYTSNELYQEELERIFERFRRGGNAAAMNEEGLGLGLPVAKAIVEAHKGRIEMASRVGEGTTVTVALPAETAEASK